MKLKSLFILFFSIFLLSLSSEAMAAIIPIGENSVCATECTKIGCTAATDTNSLTSAVTDVSVGPNASFNCSEPAAGKAYSDVVAAMQPSCITKCNNIKIRIKIYFFSYNSISIITPCVYCIFKNKSLLR